MQAYFEEHQIAYERIPLHNPGCEIFSRIMHRSITAPDNGSEYLISKKNPEPLQLACNTSNDVQQGLLVYQQ